MFHARRTPLTNPRFVCDLGTTSELEMHQKGWTSTNDNTNTETKNKRKTTPQQYICLAIGSQKRLPKRDPLKHFNKNMYLVRFLVLEGASGH